LREFNSRLAQRDGYSAKILTGKIDIVSLTAMNSLSRYADTVFCLMRLIVGLLFACHGGQKILGFPPSAHPGGPLDALGLVGAWIELAGGFLIAFGLFTRIAAFISSGEMAVAYFMVHASGGFFPIQNHGESAVIYCWVFLFIFFHGAGRWSLDALLFRKSAASNA
jgi:putative oxidoreductase